MLSFVDEDAALLNELGLNVIRLGSQWAGAAPAPGTIDQAYLDQLAKIVATCAAHNITVFFDAHQDCFSEQFCGEGVPLWAAKNNTDFPVPLQLEGWLPAGPHGVPSLEQCSQFGWSLYQLTYAGADGGSAAWCVVTPPCA